MKKTRNTKMKLIKERCPLCHRQMTVRWDAKQELPYWICFHCYRSFDSEGRETVYNTAIPLDKGKDKDGQRQRNCQRPPRYNLDGGNGTWKVLRRDPPKSDPNNDSKGEKKKW